MLLSAFLELEFLLEQVHLIFEHYDLVLLLNELRLLLLERGFSLSEVFGGSGVHVRHSLAGIGLVREIDEGNALLSLPQFLGSLLELLIYFLELLLRLRDFQALADQFA